VATSQGLSSLQWQLIMKCWRQNLRPGLASWWGPSVFKVGALALWLTKLPKTNGPRFTWPLMMFAGALPEPLVLRAGKLHDGRPLQLKTRAQLLASINPHYWQFLREDTGDMPAMTTRGEEAPFETDVPGVFTPLLAKQGDTLFPRPKH
jgi:hypothetical protein